MGIQLIMTTVLATTVTGCSWAHPGANPYRGDPVAALADFDLRQETRRKLAAMMAVHATTDVATITRDRIAGATDYADLREMHSGHGQVCHGAVDRSAWSATRRERGLVYCADDACVIVPTICNNVSLVTRRPEHPVAGDEGPIDISPAAGPPAGSAPVAETDRPGETFAQAAPGFFEQAPPGGAGGGAPPVTSSDGTPPGDGLPVIGPLPGAPVGTGGCCAIVGTTPTTPSVPSTPDTPAAPGTPGTPDSPLAPISEAPTWALLMAGLAAMVATARRRPARGA